MTADEQVVAVALAEAAGDGHRGTAGARAVDVGDVGLAHRGERLRGIDLDAEFAGAAVEIEGAGLEGGEAIARVEIREVDEIVEQRAEVPRVAEQFLDVGDCRRLGGEGGILRDESGESFLAFAGEDGLHAIEAEGLDRGAGFAGAPRLVGGEFAVEVGPLGGGERSLAGAERRGDGGAMQRGDGGGPRGVDPIGQREGAAGFDAREREERDLGGRGGELLGGEGGEISLGAVDDGGGAGVERREPAAGEEILDLGAHGLHGGEGGGGVGAEGRGVAGGPRGKGGAVREEGVDARLIDAGGGAAIGDGALGGDDVGDELGDRGIRRGRGGDDAVAVELGAGENLRGVGRVGEGDHVAGLA